MEPQLNQNYKVLCISFTYNQATYIKDTLNGFSIQETEFPFVCCIIDDASKDGEQNVIKKWLDDNCDMSNAIFYESSLWHLIMVNHFNNKNCTFAVYFLKQNLKGTLEKKEIVDFWREHTEYEAICEGDDYWTNPCKLSKQIDYLDNHPECGMCYSLAHILNQAKGEFEGIGGNPCVGFDDMILGNSVPNLTSCIRNTIRLEYENEISSISRGWKMGDYPLWLWVTTRYKIYCINEVMAVYRVLPNSASHSQDIEKNKNFNQSILDVRMFFWEKYSGDEELRIKILDSYYRLNFEIGRNFGDWQFCFDNIQKIKTKGKRDYLRIALYWLMKSVKKI